MKMITVFAVPGMSGQWEKNIKIGKILCEKRLKP